MTLRAMRVELDLARIPVDWIYRAITHGGDIFMRIRFLSTIAAVAVLIVGVQHVAAQQMSPFPMMGGYPQAAPTGYQAAYMPAMPPQFDVRQAAMASQGEPVAGCQDSGEGACNQCNACGGVASCWCHSVSVWGEYLYLRPRNAEVAYGVPINGAIIPPPVNPIQIGRVGMVDPDFSSGIRFGVSYVLDGCSSITAQYTWFESRTDDQVSTEAPFVIRSLVSHPGTLTAAQDFLTARASQQIRFDWFDVDYRTVLDCCDNRLVTFLVGARMGQFNQDFVADYLNTGTETVETEIDFYGAGLRVGLEGERYSNSRRWLVYGKTAASLVAGEFTADYRQGQSFDPMVVDTTWKAGRVLPMLDLELGAGWQSRCGTWRITGGYAYNAWFNAVKTDEWVKSVQSNNFVGLSDGMSFDGVVLRCEGRF